VTTEAGISMLPTISLRGALEVMFLARYFIPFEKSHCVFNISVNILD
jgi:hypothetical protein